MRQCWENNVEPDRSQMKIWRIRISCQIPKATNTHSEYVILIASTVVARTRLHVTLRVPCFFFFFFFFSFFLVSLPVHLSIFTSVINQLDAQSFVSQQVYFTPLHVSSTCAHHQEVKIALHSLWYRGSV